MTKRKEKRRRQRQRRREQKEQKAQQQNGSEQPIDEELATQMQVWAVHEPRRDVAEFPSPAESAESVILLLPYMGISQVTGGMRRISSGIRRFPGGIRGNPS